MRRSVDRTGDMVEFFEGLFGPYPFDSVGAIVDDAPQVGYALETQTRPIYDRVPGDTTVAHEIAHQWFGDSVTPRQWPDMWLNEGFATWAEWRWDQEAGGQTTAQVFAGLQAQPPTRDDLWEPPPAAIPGPAELFSTSVYVRGAMALEALRQQVGNATFLGILRSWAADRTLLQRHHGRLHRPRRGELGPAARRPLPALPVQARQALSPTGVPALTRANPCAGWPRVPCLKRARR